MNGKVLLDTNIIIALFARDSEVHRMLSATLEVFIPSIVIGELFYGAYKSKDAQTNLSRVEDFARHSTVLPCDTTIAKQYGRIKHFLRSKGRPIPENDIWIAAIAHHYQLTLVTRDEHFKAIEPLSLAMW